MHKVRLWLLSCVGLLVAVSAAQAHINKEPGNSPKEQNRVQFRENCDQATAQTDMSINNVRARLLTGGDVWWDTDDGRYVVPKVQAGETEVSSIFAGAVWLGGVDPAGNLKVAAQTYGSSSNNADFWPGPLTEIGTTDQETCATWDRFFRVTGAEIDEHLRNYQAAVEAGKPYDEADIPKAVRGWPARGNQFFFDVNEFELPDTRQGLAGFFDRDGDDNYEPDDGDYPVIQVRGCELTQYPDEMVFWVYNDAGNIHSQSMGDPIQMEVQVQAFAYATNDELNDMTFQRYKLINRAIESIDSTFFAMWVDPDLGCYTDDYVGCDTLRSLGYVYNADALDGQSSCNDCPGGVPTYCTEIPILGVDYFRGPLDENFQELGMSSFTYYNNASQGNPPPGTTDPNNAQEYYNYISGSWRDGSPFTFGDDAYQDGETLSYAFVDAPNDPNGWSMCSQGTDPNLDRRTLQASGPFRLDPGAINELIIGVVWVADQLYPCPSIRALQSADDIAQALFDNCFDITDGPDAPDVDFIELDKEIIAVFTNDEVTSNNAFEQYSERGLRIPDVAEDSLYRFEGYKLYQLSGSNVTIADLNDPDKARLIYQVDIENGIDRIFNWEEVEAPGGDAFRTPVVQVEGADEGIRHTFRITEDQFAQGDRRLINHKKYYFTAIAYAYNNYEEYDPTTGIGQPTPYLEGRRNIGDGENPFYTVLPRPINYEKLNASYGDGAVITRLDGIGTGGNFLEISDETRDAILSGEFDGTVTYEPGGGPVDINVFNPLEVKDGEFILTFVDENLSNSKIEEGARWQLIDVNRNIEIMSDASIDKLNEQILAEYGFSITIGQTPDAGDLQDNNGVIGYEEVYTDSTAEAWYDGIPDGFTNPFLPGTVDDVFNYVLTGTDQPDESLDPNQDFTTFGEGYWIPYTLADWRTRPAGIGYYISPAWTLPGGQGGNIVRNSNELDELNNVDIVFTPDKSKWSRCVVVETASPYYPNQGLMPEGNVGYFDLRAAPSVGKEDADGDGLPDPDGDGMGMGWFPGYAIDVETGERLNIFFGENSVYQELQVDSTTTVPLTGADMMWNPLPISILFPQQTGGNFSIFNFIAGAQHFVYVTRQKYDECAAIRSRLNDDISFRKVQALQQVTWTSIPLATREFRSYADGLIPSELKVKLRVDNPYQVSEGTGEYDGYPTYQFELDGVAPAALTNPEVETALDNILVVPNPYYGFSSYENSQFSNIVKITNLPAVCTVTIYSLDGKFIRQYNRNELGEIPDGNNRAIQEKQINPDLEWDLKNNKGIPVASGVYLMHIDAGELGERVIKWFGVARKFDPSGL